MNRSKLKIYITSHPAFGIPGFFFEHPEWIAFAVIFGLMLWLNLHRSDFEFYGDAAIYWQQAKTFQDAKTGQISLLNFDSPLRGYLFPLILYAIILLSSFLRMPDKYILEIIQSLVFSGTITVIFPYVLKNYFGNKPGGWQVLLFGLLVIFFWHGFLFYPLSDFWALSFLIFGFFLFLYYRNYKWALFLTGVFFGGAVLIRPAYSITLIFLLVWGTTYFLRRQNQTKWRVLINGLFIVTGLAFVFLPQLAINTSRFGVVSPLPLARLPNGKSLFLQQLTWGIQIQRYEGALTSKNKRPLEGVFFTDLHGRNILVRSGFDPNSLLYSETNILSLTEYIQLVLKHPFDFAVLYTRHLFNGLDMAYSTPYIDNLYKSTIHIRLLNYSLWFLAILYISRRLKISEMQDRQFWVFLIFVLPSLLSIPTAVEVRFMLPLYITSYTITAFFVLPAFLSLTRECKINTLLRYMPWYGAFTVTCLLLSISAFTHMMYNGFYIFW